MHLKVTVNSSYERVVEVICKSLTESIEVTKAVRDKNKEEASKTEVIDVGNIVELITTKLKSDIEKELKPTFQTNSNDELLNFILDIANGEPKSGEIEIDNPIQCNYHSCKVSRGEGEVGPFDKEFQAIADEFDNQPHN